MPVRGRGIECLLDILVRNVSERKDFVRKGDKNKKKIWRSIEKFNKEDLSEEM